MDERRSTGEVLLRLKGSIPEDEASDAELLVKTRITVSKRKGFKKQPDAPLGIVLAATKSGRLSLLLIGPFNKVHTFEI